jgi:hypothetical protein
MRTIPGLEALHADAREIIRRQSDRKDGPLLKDSDNNIGNSVEPVASAQTTLIPETNPPRVLNLGGSSEVGQMMTVVITANLKPVPSTVFEVPTAITAVVEFGNGGVFTRAEVDVPVGPINFSAVKTNESADGGTVVRVPAGALRVYARNDAHLIVPTVLGFAFPGTNPPVTAVNVAPVLVKAFTGYYSHGALHPPHKTLHLTKNPTVLPFIPFDIPAFAYPIPAFAKRFRLLRTSAGNPDPAVTGTVYDSNGNALMKFSVAGGAPFNMIDLPGTANRIGISTVIPAGTGYCAFDHEIGL